MVEVRGIRLNSLRKPYAKFNVVVPLGDDGLSVACTSLAGNQCAQSFVNARSIRVQHFMESGMIKAAPFYQASHSPRVTLCTATIDVY